MKSGIASVLIAPAILFCLGCSASSRVTTVGEIVPDDKQDDTAALQAALDKVGANGGGVLRLPKGQIDISRPLFIPSGVTLEGDSGGTLLTNRRFNDQVEWGGVVLLAGNMAPASYQKNAGRGYPGVPITKASNKLVQLGRECANLPKVGDVVWLSTIEGTVGAGGFVRPKYSAMNAVSDIRGCSVSLMDDLQMPKDSDIQLHWSDRSKTFPRSLRRPNEPVRDVVIRNLTVESAEGLWIKPGGCYHCKFENIEVLRSRRLVELEGNRHSVYRNIRGNFTERGIEVAMYATDNLVDGVFGRYESRWKLKERPVLRFGEQARYNTVRNVIFEIGDGYRGRRDKIRFDDGSKNIVENVTLKSKKFGSEPAIFFSRGYTPQKLENIRECQDTPPGGCRPARSQER